MTFRSMQEQSEDIGGRCGECGREFQDGDEVLHVMTGFVHEGCTGSFTWKGRP